MKAYRYLSLILLLMAVVGCTSLQEIRVNHTNGKDLPAIDANNPDAGCVFASNTRESRAYSLEDYGDFWAGYVEFDDEGWQYRTPGQQTQMDVLERRIKEDLANPKFVDDDFLVIAFIHGWHHNAHDEDCNVHEFRAMLKTASERYAKAYPNPLKHKRRIIGVYVGWRGESLNINGLRYTTVLDRRNAAERIAKGDVRQLFATLRSLQITASRKASRDDRMRTVVVGHSFGGLIAFNGLSPAVLNELTLTRPESELNCLPSVIRERSDTGGARKGNVGDPPLFPDMLVLINPAFESTRFEPLHTFSLAIHGCPYPDLRPKLVAVVADNDIWTGGMFTLGRTFLTALEAYPHDSDTNARSLERQANLHTTGFNPRYVTHCLRIERDNYQRTVAKLVFQPSKEQSEPIDPYAPVWVIRAPKEIINGHSGFLYPQWDESAAQQRPYLLDWLVTLHSQWTDKDTFLANGASCD